MYILVQCTCIYLAVLNIISNTVQQEWYNNGKHLHNSTSGKFLCSCAGSPNFETQVFDSWTAGHPHAEMAIFQCIIF